MLRSHTVRVKPRSPKRKPSPRHVISCPTGWTLRGFRRRAIRNDLRFEWEILETYGAYLQRLFPSGYHLLLATVKRGLGPHKHRYYKAGKLAPFPKD